MIEESSVILFFFVSAPIFICQKEVIQRGKRSKSTWHVDEMQNAHEWQYADKASRKQKANRKEITLYGQPKGSRFLIKLLH